MSEAKETIKSLFLNTKKLGRISALVIILGVAGTISILMIQGIDNNDAITAIKVAEFSKTIFDQWIDLAKIAVMFYFMKSMNKDNNG